MHVTVICKFQCEIYNCLEKGPLFFQNLDLHLSLLDEYFIDICETSFLFTLLSLNCSSL